MPIVRHGLFWKQLRPAENTWRLLDKPRQGVVSIARRENIEVPVAIEIPQLNGSVVQHPVDHAFGGRKNGGIIGLGPAELNQEKREEGDGRGEQEGGGPGRLGRLGGRGGPGGGGCLTVRNRRRGN